MKILFSFLCVFLLAACGGGDTSTFTVTRSNEGTT